MNPHLYLADFAAGEIGGRAPAYHLRLDGDSVRADGVEFDGPLELLLRMVRDAMDAGAAGIMMGRNIWDHENAAGMTAALAAIVHDDAAADTAVRLIR